MIALLLGGNQSALNPQGPHALSIAQLNHFMTVALSAAYLITMAMLAWALFSARRRRYAGDVLGRNLVIAWGLAIPIAVLLIILFYSLGVGRTFATAPFKDAMTVHLTGKQWWWQVRYIKGSDVVASTANEIHLPVRTPVTFKLNSNDVIHSFWVPNLSGKMDLIPGRTNEIWLRADREGVWRGECAEFCGVQHAHMALEVVAEQPAKFYEWMQRQRQPAPEPSSEMARRGREIFLKGPCVMCHKISGTPAGGSVGPDLTHVAGRRTIAAATLPNNRGNLAGWIANAQGVKPGSQMPRMNLSAGELEALLSYLETLQ
jgi:cytochrome c oxidase subunit 2